ncbi:MAG: lipocalin family protein [Bacteriovoracaceae bacterium]
MFKKLTLLIIFFSFNTHAVCSHNIINTLERKGNFNTLLTLLEQTGLSSVLKSSKKVTLFAPNDRAFSQASVNSFELENILLYHIANKKLKSKKVLKVKEVETLLGKILIPSVNDKGVFLNNAKVIHPDMRACNGVIHEIDKILIPTDKTPLNDPTTVKAFDLERYMGSWYEIARYDYFFQRFCGAAKATYTLGKGRVKVLNECRTIKDPSKIKKAKGVAFVTDKKSNSKLKVGFAPIFKHFGLFAGEYWILDIDENYQNVLIGDSKREFLWILSRNKSIDSSRYNKMVDLAKSLGFNTKNLKRTPTW